MIKTKNVLVVDDDLDIINMLDLILRKAGYGFHFATNGQDGIQACAQNTPDIILLDVMMPEMDGVEVLATLRQITQVPVIMVTAVGQEDTVVQSFDLGADDYVIKPFSPKVLVARIEAILNRVERQLNLPSIELVCNGLKIHLVEKTVTFQGSNIDVTPLEYDLLSYMIQRKGLNIAKAELFQEVWGYDMPEDDLNIVEVAIRRLRKKIEPVPSKPRYILTVRGFGYRLCE